MTGPGGAAAFFEELRREYLAEAAARLGELRKDLAALRAGEPDAATSLKIRLHRLAGSGGSYGFPEISAASRATELWIGANPTPDAAGLSQLERSISEIAQAFDAAAAQLGLPGSPARPSAFGWRALLVADPGALADRVEATLLDAQYTVQRKPMSADPATIPVSARPDVAVIVATTREETANTVARWASPNPSRPGSVILVAAPATADPLVPPVVEVDGVVGPDRVEAELLRSVRTLGRSATAPRSVLIVDPDDQGAVRTLTTALEGAAVKVTQATGGLPARELLREPPDLILMEWRLPDTMAPALIRWIRQQPAFRLTPIVVAATTISDEDRLRAIRAGADDVVLKTATAAHLCQLVLARIERSRSLRVAAHRDDLTGLLNHEAMVEELERAIGYARRATEPVAFFMLDLDHFRRINERHGPTVGDAVLVHVARRVAGSVRSSDLVARMGGEEFGVLVRRCRAVDASRVAEKVRNAVSDAAVHLGEESVSVRVSVGVACYPDHGGSGQEVLRVADKALATAKQTGRDRVVVG